MEPDLFIEVRFATANEGGRRTPLVIGTNPYGCVLLVGDDAFECRLLLTNQELQLGNIYELPVKFANASLALPKLPPGAPVRLWEGREIGEGKVVRIVRS